MRLIAGVLFTLIAAGACKPDRRDDAAAQEESANARQAKPVIGVAGMADGWCLATPDSALQIGDTVQAASIPLVGSARASFRGAFIVVGQESGSCPEWGEFGDMALRLERADGETGDDGLPDSGPLVVVSGGAPLVALGPTGVSVDFDQDGAPDVFRACTSREGIHLTLWSGRPLVGERLWHSYFFLGYDVHPTCEEADFDM
ncbi:MAG: hypothetical protein ABFS34_05015 [Gemmatimonadota bacterium]